MYSIGKNVIAMALDFDTVYSKYEKIYKQKPAHKNLYHFYAIDRNDDCIILPSKKAPVEWDEESYNYFLTSRSKN